MLKKKILAILIVLGVFIIDRITKNYFLIHPSVHIEVIPSFLHFYYVENDGIAFGMFKGFNKFFLIFNSAVLAFLLYIRRSFKENLPYYSIHLIIGGALGNIYDRISHGYIVDFIDLKYFPAVFNMADFSITCGMVMLFIYFLREELDSRRKKNEIS